jgi:signal transduction histidine kinase
MTAEPAQERSRDERIAELGTLLAGFAHEIRNPLSTIGLNLGLIKEDFAGSEDARERRTHRRISVLEEEIRRLQTILDDFLRYARPPDLELRATDLVALLQAIAEFVAPELEQDGIALHCYAEGGVGMPLVDRDQMRAAIVNLIRNAKEACSRGGQVILSVRREGQDVLLRIADSGSGMSPEVRARAFEPYFSTKKHGTGLGLPTVKRIVEGHGGRIELDSEPGRGTQFTIRLPVRDLLPGGAPPARR